MASFGAMNPQIKMMNQILPQRGPAAYTAGIKDSDKGSLRYGPKSSDNPSLMIVDSIYDNDGNSIAPGYYELVLSMDRDMLLLEQSEKIVAKIPVFKVEVDRTQEQAAQPNNKKAQKAFNKEQKKKEKERKKLYKAGKIPSMEPEIYSNATIQFDVKGDYYLIKYERGKIRAWGAIK